MHGNGSCISFKAFLSTRYIHRTVFLSIAQEYALVYFAKDILCEVILYGTERLRIYPLSHKTTLRGVNGVHVRIKEMYGTDIFIFDIHQCRL